MDLESHKEFIISLVTHYIDARIEIVPDISEWCAQASEGKYLANELDNPIGKALWNSPVEPNLILLRKVLTEEQIANHLVALFLKGFKRVYYHIPDNITFMKHLVLHEVAHIKHDWKQDRELDCNKWAFKELKKWIKT